MKNKTVNRTLKLGTRGSKLALWQANHIADLLRAAGQSVEIVEISTIGDRDQSPDLASLPTVGVFTKELQRALLNADVDFAVHSLKDLPTTPVDGLTLAAIPTREVAVDALVTSRAACLDELPSGARIGTGSLRRQAQLRSYNAEWTCEPIRGNVDTRLRKLDEGQFDAIILAAAGLSRLGLADRIAEWISIETLLPAPGQGALGIECRLDDTECVAALAPLTDPVSRAEVTAERALLAAVEGGCLAALGAYATLHEGHLQLRSTVLLPDGSRRIDDQLAEPVDPNEPGEAMKVGQRLAARMLERGAGELLSARH